MTKIIWKASLVLLLGLILSACSPTTAIQTSEGDSVDETEAEEATAVLATLAPTKPPEPTNSPAQSPTETAVVEETSDETAVPEQAPAVEESEETIVLENGTEISTVDDRSAQLQSLTRAWNTNWNLHSIDYSEILSGGPPRDGIPSIDAPVFIEPEEADAWLADNEPVIAVEIDGDARAYPLQVLTWHEIVNDTVNDVPVVVTFCPLCNSAVVFERTVDGDPVEFGVSGLLRHSDLIMYDRTDESLWQQFTGEAIVGNHTGKQLTFLPSSLISFADFKKAYPDGVVLSRETGFSRPYGQNPYAGYDTIGSNPFLFRGEIDGRLPAVARVVTVSLPEVDVAYPVDLLAEVGVIDDTQGGQDLVVFHTPGTASALGASTIADAEDVGATGVFDPSVNGQRLTFTRDGDTFVDDQTGSRWNIVGQATEGPLAGEQLTKIVSGDHFWFSWAAFKPETVVYSE